MNELFTPLLFLRVKHAVKPFYDVVYPLVFAVAAGSIILWWPHEFALVGQDSLVQALNSLIGILIGFYIAALAAVATFDRPEMDELMKGDPATLDLPGRDTPLLLTRRIFLTLLFGHLTLVSIMVFVAFSCANVMLAQVHVDDGSGYGLARAAFVYVYCFLIGHILSESLLGVYYLAWRAVIFDPKIIASNDDR